jgi:hypothetical protein
MDSLEMSQSARELKPGIYRHYKGNLYEVMGVCRHSETQEEMVAYRKLYGDFGWWVRPLGMFVGRVDAAKDPAQPLRFEFVGRNH